MSDESRRRGLGRGLSALLGEPIVEVTRAATAVAGEEGDASESGTIPASGKTVRTIPVESLTPGKYQPRRVFDEEAINDLVESVRAKGILQPLLARPHPSDQGLYEIIAGERRWRAAQAAGLHEVPVLVRDLTDREALEIGLIENLQRQDLSPLEEAEGYRRLMEDFEHTQEALAKVVGKSRSHVANTMRLLALPAPIKHMLDGGELSAGHARALLTCDDPVAVAQQVISKGLNVRQTEKLAQKDPAKTSRKGKGPEEKDPDILALERDLSNLLGLKVVIRFGGKGGELLVQYGTLEQLDDILHRLSGGMRGRAAAEGAAREDGDSFGAEEPLEE